MHILDLLSLSLSLIGIYGVVVVALRVLLPRNIVPLISELFDKTMALTQQAEAINVPNASYYQENLAAVREQFLQMRIGSHRSPGIFQQLYLCIGGLTWRLYGLKLRIETIKRQLELKIDECTMNDWTPVEKVCRSGDERRLGLHTNVNAQSATTTALPFSAAGTDMVIHRVNAVKPNLPSQAVLNVA